MDIKTNKIFEFIFGISSLFGIFILCIMILNNTYIKSIFKTHNSDYTYYYASFEDIDGVFTGSDIRLAGINIGKVDDISINQNSEALIKLKILKKYKISKDALIIVATSGFLGSKYLRITPGIKAEYLEEGESFLFTQSSLNVENLISLLKK
jgi:phospholipid/cholesterol/gamma-HCH transport system substrate-binding protein